MTDRLMPIRPHFIIRMQTDHQRYWSIHREWTGIYSNAAVLTASQKRFYRLPDGAEFAPYHATNPRTA